MPDKSWKVLERRTAKKLGGKRVPCNGNTEGFEGDVLHERFYIECKYRAALAFKKWFDETKKIAKEKDKIPLLVLKMKGKHGEFAVLELDTFSKMNNTCNTADALIKESNKIQARFNELEKSVNELKVRKEFLPFLLECERKMKENDAEKGDSWKEMSVEQLKELLKKEIVEFEESGSKGELVDMVNMAMMLWHRIGARETDSFRDAWSELIRV